MDITSNTLREYAARGEEIDLLAVAQKMERLEDELTRVKSRLEQKSTQVSLMLNINHMALESAASGRTIEAMREEVLAEGTKRDTQLYNAFEVRQCIYALDHAEEAYATLKVAYDQIDVESSPARSVKQVMDAINNNVIGPFSFKEVHAWTEYLRENAGLNRPLRKNIREVFALLKAQPDAQFYGEEVRMVRKWGTDHDRNLSIVKTRLGRAFTDPVGYMDPRFDLMLSKVNKRQLLEGKALTAQAYQHAVFARPDFLNIAATWKIGSEKNQFHAGEHWHTDSAGRWWCAEHFQGMTARELMTHLEMTLGELRLLYIHFPEGIVNDETE